MGLETAIAENTAAVRDLITITTKLFDLRADAIEKVTGAAATKTTDKKAAEKAKTEEPKQQIQTGGERVDPAENPYESVKELIVGYVGGSERAEERDARKAKIRELLNHAKIKKPDLAADAKPDASNIMIDAIPLFKDQIAKLTAKGDITKPPVKTDDLDL